MILEAVGWREGCRPSSSFPGWLREVDLGPGGGAGPGPLRAGPGKQMAPQSTGKGEGNARGAHP